MAECFRCIGATVDLKDEAAVQACKELHVTFLKSMTGNGLWLETFGEDNGFIELAKLLELKCLYKGLRGSEFASMASRIQASELIKNTFTVTKFGHSFLNQIAVAVANSKRLEAVVPPS